MVNQLVICRDKYKTQDEFENAIKNAIILLLDAEYIMTVKYDEKAFGHVLIEYECDNVSLGGQYPYWLYPHEYESIK